MHKSFCLVSWIHLILIMAAWSSPAWVDYRLILLGIVGLNIQYLLLGGCCLTILEDGQKKYSTFYHLHLKKFFPALSEYKVWLFVRLILPVLILGSAFWLQTQLGLVPLITAEWVL